MNRNLSIAIAILLFLGIGYSAYHFLFKKGSGGGEKELKFPIAIGSSGQHVTTIQMWLNDKVIEGGYGPLLLLVEDGEFGPLTRDRLNIIAGISSVNKSQYNQITSGTYLV
jgi:hypothetical protein